MRQAVLPLAVACLFVPAARSAAPPPVAWTPWTVADVVSQETATDFSFSPDGRYLLWEKTTLNKEKNAYVTHLFRHDCKTGRQVQLTRGSESCTASCWSPDGSHIAFLSSRPAPREKEDKGRRRGRAAKSTDEPKAQVWLLDATGGEPWPLTDLSRDVKLVSWISADTLLFAAREEPGRRESELKDDRKDTSEVVEDDAHEPPVRLFSVDVKSKKVQRKSDNRDRIEQLAVSPDGKYAVTGHARSLRYTYDNKIKPVFFIHNLSAGKPKPVLADATLNISHLLWSPDGKGFYAVDERSRRPQLNQAGVSELLYHDVRSARETRVDLDWPRGLATQEDNDAGAGVVPVADGFLALLANGVRPRLAHYQRAGTTFRRHWVSGECVENVFGLTATRDGEKVAFCHSTASSPPRWYSARLGRRKWSNVELVTAGTNLETRRMARREIVHWKGAKGDEVEGLLFYPHDWKPGKRAPLVVQIHGGPASADHDNWDESWAYSANLVCQRGAFVLRPNYHGSTGYGLDWLESIANGHYCDLETQDIENGVDELIRKGLVDGDKLALSGWSNGAILTNVLITQTTRYRAAVAGAGSVEYVSDWSSCEFGDAFDRFYFGKTPLEDLSLYLRKSPFYRLDKVRTPTLLLFGTEDRVVHPQQGWALYRGLQQLGKVPVRFVQFPDEKHSLKNPAHRQRKLEEELAWLDRYLFDSKGKPLTELVKADSPLSWLIARQKASRVGNRYGVMKNGVLVPETVEFSGTRPGRFELTQAQYAQFERNFHVESGMDNHPVANVSFAQARAYCAWLSQKTGRKYRLPTEKEADVLYESSEEGENTLDNWAGYAVNPDDAVRLRREVDRLPPGALIRAVGSGRGRGKGNDVVFDLGGNVAEWVEGKNGKGVSRGGSADSPADAKGKTLSARPNYQGFRVVLD